MSAATTLIASGGGGTPDVPAARLPIRGAFCSSYDRKGRVVFDPQYFPYLWWQWKSKGDTTARDDFYNTLSDKWAAGVTHVVLDPPDGSVYDADWMHELPNWIDHGRLHPDFVEMCDVILAQGFVGVFYCYGGGQTDAVHIYDGELRRMAEQIRDTGWTPRLVTLWAWETFGRDPECTAKQNSDAWLLLHEVLGDDAMLAEHVGSKSPQRFTWASYPVEPDDPSHGDEIGAHYTAGGKWVQVYFGQLESFGREGPGHGWESRMIEGLDRFYKKGDPIPGIGQGYLVRDPDDHGYINPSRYAIGPDWFDGSRPPGRMEYCDWEPGIPYPFIRHECGIDVVLEHQRVADLLNIRSQGCLPVPPRG